MTVAETPILKQRNRIALVTGAARGIGAAICHRLAEDGATVVAVGLDGDAAAEVAAQLPYGGAGLRCDIADRDEVEATVADVVRQFGGIDILVNNAAIARTAAFVELSDPDWHDVLATNLTGSFYVTQSVARVMRERAYGRIVFVSSLAALGNPFQASYAAAKAGIGGLAKTVALELGEYGITCNVVAPGVVETEMARSVVRDKGQQWAEHAAGVAARTAVRRIGQPADIAAAVAFLSLPESGFVTGQTLYATGSPVA